MSGFAPRICVELLRNRLHIFVSFISFYIVNKSLNLLFIFFFTDKQSVFIIYNNVVFQALHNNNFFIGGINNIVFRIIKDMNSGMASYDKKNDVS